MAFSFVASYDVLFDGWDIYDTGGDDANFNISVARLSGDGSRIAFAGHVRYPSTYTTDYRLYIVDFDGSNLLEIPLPVDPDPMRVYDIAINEDGSRFFFMTPWYQHRIYRVDVSQGPVDPQVTQIADLLGLHNKEIASAIKTTAAGDWVYYTDWEYQVGTGDLLRLSWEGGLPEVVIDDTAVPIEEAGVGWQVRDFDISDDGSAIVFSLEGYWDTQGVRHDRWFGWLSLDSTGFHQLTPIDKAGETPGVISGDGSKIVFSDSSNSYKYLSVDTGGATPVEIEDKGYNFAGASLNQRGTRLFYADHLARSGRIANTDGRGGEPILPDSDVNAIRLEVNADAQFSSDGQRVAFISRVPTGPWTEEPLRLYAGIFNDRRWASAGPAIADIAFSPPFIGEDINAQVLLTSSATAGVGGVERVSLDSIVNGRYYGSSPWEDFSYGFLHHPVDDGVHPDVTAGDGIYSAVTSKNPDYAGSPLYRITARVGFMDSVGNVAVADRTLWAASDFCSGDDVSLTDHDFLPQTYSICVGGSTMSLGSAVQVLAGASVVVSAPRTLLRAGFRGWPGAALQILVP
ncbi:hypothetical protein CKO23_08470 [Thiocystis violacea]|nr:hypothetical protein [Thiocystis violacea]